MVNTALIVIRRGNFQAASAGIYGTITDVLYHDGKGQPQAREEPAMSLLVLFVLWALVSCLVTPVIGQAMAAGRADLGAEIET